MNYDPTPARKPSLNLPQNQEKAIQATRQPAILGLGTRHSSHCNGGTDVRDRIEIDMKEQEKKELLELVNEIRHSMVTYHKLDKLKAKIEAIPTDEPKTENIAKAIELLKESMFGLNDKHRVVIGIREAISLLKPLPADPAPNLARYPPDAEREAIEQDESELVECEASEATFANFNGSFSPVKNYRSKNCAPHIESRGRVLDVETMIQCGAKFYKPKPEPVVVTIDKAKLISLIGQVAELKEFARNPSQYNDYNSTTNESMSHFARNIVKDFEDAVNNQPPISEVK